MICPGWVSEIVLCCVVMDGIERMLRVVAVVVVVAVSLIRANDGVTDPGDAKILNEFRDGMDNPEVLGWPVRGDDPCGPPAWPYVYCSGQRVAQIQAKGLGLKGKLPSDFNRLSLLSNLGLQRNKLYGALPSFSGLSELQFVYLDYNEFDTIPSDFFDGLSSLQSFALDYNPLNATLGWSIPTELAKSAQLVNLSLISCNLVGPLPEFLGEMSSLTELKLSYNALSGEIPASFGPSMLQILWLNDQGGGGSGLRGGIDVVASMRSLSQLWLHGNQFDGTIPERIGDLTSLKDLNLNTNQLVGQIPDSLANLELERLDLNNNMLVGPIPKFKARNVTYAFNSFCQSQPGIQCSREVSALLGFLGGIRYPTNLVTRWSGNDPCVGPWFGLSCNSKGEVSIINLPRHNLSGTLSPSIANLNSLLEIRLGENGICGRIPGNYTDLRSLRLLDMSNNNLEPPLPEFNNDVKVMVDGNPLLLADRSSIIPAPATSPVMNDSSSSPPSMSGAASPKPAESPPSLSRLNISGSPPAHLHSGTGGSIRRYEHIVVSATAALGFVLLASVLFICCRKKRKHKSEAPGSVVIHPRDPSDPLNRIKVTVSDNTKGSLLTHSGASSGSTFSIGTDNSHSVQSGNVLISVHVLRKVTDNFAPDNEIGRGGFGTVYKGELHDGTKIAVKRMESGVVCGKALTEFQSEIAVLSKVRHRNLVSLLGYSTEGNERLLVYEYMSQGALSKHLFHWKTKGMEPLSWRQRFTIALDVARGVEYLHSLAQHTFIHRDLKSSNILLAEDFHAKVSDFGLVKLAPDGEQSIATRLAGTFGYLAPEYAVMGKITTKVDVFSYGVVLIEILTGLAALDEERSEESRYLVEWFWRIMSTKEGLVNALDSSIEADEETLESICTIVELAGHCTAREPQHRPDMGHVVNVLVPLVEKWKPSFGESEDNSGIDYTRPLPEMLKVWKEAESKDSSGSSRSLDDSKGSIPARPTGFADSFTSADAR